MDKKPSRYVSSARSSSILCSFCVTILPAGRHLPTVEDVKNSTSCTRCCSNVAQLFSLLVISTSRSRSLLAPPTKNKDGKRGGKIKHFKKEARIISLVLINQLFRKSSLRELKTLGALWKKIPNLLPPCHPHSTD